MQTYLVSGKYQINAFNTTLDVGASPLKIYFTDEDSMIDKDLLNILACPNCKGAVKLKDESGIVCEKCMLLYEIQEGIPVMLVDKATKIETDK